MMLSRRQKTIYFAMGSALGASLALLWSPKAGSQVRAFVRRAGDSVIRVLDNAEAVSEKVHERTGDLDKFVQELVALGRQECFKVDCAVTDTVDRYRRTTEVIEQNLVQSALELSGLLKEIKSQLERLFAHKVSRAA